MRIAIHALLQQWRGREDKTVFLCWSRILAARLSRDTVGIIRTCNPTSIHGQFRMQTFPTSSRIYPITGAGRVRDDMAMERATEKRIVHEIPVDFAGCVTILSARRGNRLGEFHSRGMGKLTFLSKDVAGELESETSYAPRIQESISRRVRNVPEFTARRSLFLELTTRLAIRRTRTPRMATHQFLHWVKSTDPSEIRWMRHSVFHPFYLMCRFAAARPS
jgi:hypothetical protein